MDQNYINIIETPTEITSAEPRTDACGNEFETGRIKAQSSYDLGLVSKITRFLIANDYAPANIFLHYLISKRIFHAFLFDTRDRRSCC